MNRKGKIILGLLEFLLWGGWLMFFPWLVLWVDKESGLHLAIASLWGVGGLIVAGLLTAALPDLFAKKFPASPTPKQDSTPKVDFRPPPKDLYEYGNDVEFSEKKKEERIVNPWKKSVLVGGKR